MKAGTSIVFPRRTPNSLTCKELRRRPDGIDVTAKALTHRFAKLRNMAAPTKDQSTATNGTDPPSTPTSSAKKTASAGNGRGKKRNATEMDSNTDADNAAEVSNRTAALHDITSPSPDGGDEGGGGPAIEVVKKSRGRKPKGEAKPKSPRGKKPKTEGIVRDAVTDEIKDESEEKTKDEDEEKIKVEDGGEGKKAEELVEMRFEEGI